MGREGGADKADAISVTPEVIYLEGVYVSLGARGKGIGTRCVSRLSRTQLERTRSICLLVNEQKAEAHAFYRKVGYTFRSYYDTIFLEQG